MTSSASVWRFTRRSLPDGPGHPPALVGGLGAGAQRASAHLLSSLDDRTLQDIGAKRIESSSIKLANARGAASQTGNSTRNQ
jgi:hypothetical protein